MESLLDGYKRFRNQGWPEQRRLFEKLAANGQRPRTLIISCIDSRVDPSRIFDMAPGEALIVRNVANLVPPYAPDSSYHGTSAALEFAVQVLKVSEIVVLGHGLCGGVSALLQGAPATAQDFIVPWISLANEARQKALQCTDPAEQQQCCEFEVIKTSLKNLMTFPWIKERVESGKLKLFGAWFAIGTGSLKLLQPDGSFAAVD